MNNTLDTKIKEYFPNESVYKNSQNYAVFSGKNLPSFIKDWLVKKYTDEDGNLYNEEILTFLEKHMPQKDSKIKGSLINGEEVKILSRMIIEPDIKTGTFKFSIPDVGIKTNEARIPEYMINKFPELRAESEVWGVSSLVHIPPVGSNTGTIELIDYKPFKPYEVEIDYFKYIREKFSLYEWLDLLISSMEYNPAGFKNIDQKLEFITRLLVFIEPRLNMIELAPKGTGKSYVFGNLSKYGWLISGGIVSRAKLFFDIAKNSKGIITMYDFVAMDEIQTIKFSNEDELKGALKGYLESGTFTVANVKDISSAGMILLGNIDFNQMADGTLVPVNPNFFINLPDFFQESALLDRFHGFIEGWHLPRMNEDMKIDGYTLNVEYFTEILHSLRDRGEYATFVNEILEIPPKADTRDVNAIKRLSTAYLKLLFPNISNTKETIENFKKYCLPLALKKRQIIREQINMIDSEFSVRIPDIKVK